MYSALTLPDIYVTVVHVWQKLYAPAETTLPRP